MKPVEPKEPPITGTRYNAIRIDRVQHRETMSGRPLCRVFAHVDGLDVELASFRDGPIEVYTYRKGLATFRGYIRDQRPAVRARFIETWCLGHNVAVAS